MSEFARGLMLIFFFFFQINESCTQNIFEDKRIELDETFLNSLKTFSNDEFIHITDSLFALIPISDSLSFRDLLQTFDIKTLYEYMNVDSLTQELDWNHIFKDTDWNRIMKSLQVPSKNNSEHGIDTSLVNSKKLDIFSSDNALGIAPTQIMKCLSYSKIFEAFDFPCYMKLFTNGDIKSITEPNINDLNKISKCINMDKFFENIDWNCVFSSIDVGKWLKLDNFSQLLDSASHESLPEFIKEFKRLESDDDILGSLNLDSLIFGYDENSPRFINSKKFAKILYSFSETFIKGKWSAHSQNIFVDKNFGVYASLLLNFHGKSKITENLITRLGLYFQKSSDLKLGRYESVLFYDQLVKDIFIDSYLENSIDDLKYKNINYREEVGRNYEVIEIASALRSIGSNQTRLGNYDHALSSLFDAQYIEEIILEHYSLNIPQDSIFIKSYNRLERDSLMSKYGISLDQLEYVNANLINGYAPYLVREKLKDKKYHEAISICLVYKDLLLTQDSLERTRPSFVQGNRMMNKTITLRSIRSLYLALTNIAQSIKSSNPQLYKKYNSQLIALYELEQKQKLVLLYNQIAAAYMGKNRRTASFEYQLKSWKLLQAVENMDYINWIEPGVDNTENIYNNGLPGHVNIITNLAIGYRQRNDFKGAQKFLNEAALFMEKVIERENAISLDDTTIPDFEQNMFTIYINLAKLHSYLNNETEAYNEFQKCLHIAQRTGEYRHWFMYYTSLGDHYIQFNKVSIALPHYIKTLSYSKEMHNEDNMAHTYCRLAECYSSANQYDKSFAYADSCSAIAKKINLNSLLIKSNNIKGYDYLKQNMLSEAEKAFDESINFLEHRILDDFHSHFSKQLNLETNFETYIGAISCAVKQNKKNKAFKYVQQVKSRTLNDQLQEGALNNEVPELLKNVRKSLILQLDESQQNRNVLLKGDENYQLQDSLLKELEIINSKIRQSSGSYSKLVNPTLPILSSIQNGLGKNQAFIEYFMGDSIYAFVTTKRKRAVFALEHDVNLFTNLNEMIRRLNSMDNHKNRSKLHMKKLGLKLDQLSEILYDYIFAPIKKSEILEDIEELIIAPDSKLYALPFEILLDQNNDSISYLGDQYNIQYYQSATIYNNQIKVENLYHEEDRLLILSKSNFRDYHNLANLKTANVEVLNGLFNNLYIIRDKEATVKQLTKMDLSNYKYIHFSTHAVIDEIPELSYLALTDSQLSLFNTFDLNLKSRVVVLSACQTGKGDFQRGGGIMGFTRGLMFAGAESVIISLWPVEDLASEYLFNKFWTGIASGESPKKALQDAKQYLRNVDEKYDNPFYWGGFVLFGNG